MSQDFNSELNLARREGVRRPENQPFLFEPAQPNGRALLLVHGFSGSPYEMRPIGEYLCAQGFLTLGVRLDGHGTTPEDLRRCRWQDWFHSVERCFHILQQRQLPISLIGQSTGALLGLALADQKPIDRLVLYSPFLKLDHPLSRFAWLLKHLFPFQQRTLPAPQKDHYYERRPLSGVEQILRLRDNVASSLGKIKTPALVLAAAGDQTVARGSGEQLFIRLGSPQKVFHLFGQQTPHVLSTDENPEFAAVCAMTLAFLNRTLPDNA